MYRFFVPGKKKSMVSSRPRRHLKTFLRLVASFSLSMSPWRAMATPFVPILMIFVDFRACRAAQVGAQVGDHFAVA